MEPILLGPGEGEEASDGERRSVLIKAGLDQLAVTKSRYAAGESGPGPHIHREHADAFYVLAGRLEFEIAGERLEVEQGGFVLVPPAIVHTFRNEGPRDARFLNFHAPSRGFDRQLRGEEIDFDEDEPPAESGRPPSEAIVLAPGEGEQLAFGPSKGLLKAQGTDGGGFAAVPPGNAHTFANLSDAPVRLLNAMAPAGFEQYLKQVVAAMRPGEPPDPQLMAEIASRHDFRPVAP